jgi:hypothetical protein
MGVRGVDCKAAFQLETGAWGSGSVQCGANDMLPFLSEAISLDKQIATDNILVGRGGKGPHSLTRKIYTGPLNLRGVYEGRTLTLLAAVMGSGSVAPVSGSVYKHTLELDKITARTGNDVSHFGTFCIEKDLYIAEYKSTKPIKVTLSLTPDNNAVLAFDLVSYSFEEDSANNSDSSAWTPSDFEKIQFEDTVISLCAYDKDKSEWGAADHVCVSELTLTIDQAPEDIITNCSAPYSEEPEAGVRTVGLTFTVPTWDEDEATHVKDFTAEIEAHTKMMMKIELIGGTIPGFGDEKYKMTFYIPTFWIMKGDVNVAGEERISVTYECLVEVPSDASIELMEQGTNNNELVVTVQNTDSAAYLY